MHRHDHRSTALVPLLKSHRPTPRAKAARPVTCPSGEKAKQETPNRSKKLVTRASLLGTKSIKKLLVTQSDDVEAEDVAQTGRKHKDLEINDQRPT